MEYSTALIVTRTPEWFKDNRNKEIMIAHSVMIFLSNRDIIEMGKYVNNEYSAFESK